MHYLLIRVQRTLKVAIDNHVSLTEGNACELRSPSSLATSTAGQAVECTLNELDSIENKPDKILAETWSKLVALRRGKFEKEQQVFTSNKKSLLISYDFICFKLLAYCVCLATYYFHAFGVKDIGYA